MNRKLIGHKAFGALMWLIDVICASTFLRIRRTSRGVPCLAIAVMLWPELTLISKVAQNTLIGSYTLANYTVVQLLKVLFELSAGS